MKISKLLRTVQTFFPGLIEAKFALMRVVRQCFRIPFETDFNALKYMQIPDHALFLDIGANRGQSIDAIRLFVKDCQIISFEPNPALADALKQRYPNHAGITIHDFGLGDQQGEFVLHIPQYRKWLFDGLASMTRESAEGWLVNNIYCFRPGLLSIQEARCFIRRLDDLDVSPFFIKIDVQGFELSVLQGARETLKRHEPILLIETPNTHLIEWLIKLGYESYAFDGGLFLKGKLGYLNTFFLTKGKAGILDKYHLSENG